MEQFSNQRGGSGRAQAKSAMTPLEQPPRVSPTQLPEQAQSELGGAEAVQGRTCQDTCTIIMIKRMDFINSIPSCKYNIGYKPLQIRIKLYFPKENGGRNI